MIKGIIFDFGNVLCTFTNELFLHRLSDITGKSRDKLFDIIYIKSGLPKKFESGEISTQQFFEELSKICGLTVPYKELHEIYSKDKFTRIEGMCEIAQSLMKKYKVALLSNTGEWDFEYMKQVAPEIRSFTTISTSFESKAMKPSTKMYTETLQKLQLLPEECIYTDDIIEYVTVSQSLGMNGVHFKGKDDFVASLAQLGVVI